MSLTCGRSVVFYDHSRKVSGHVCVLWRKVSGHVCVLWGKVSGHVCVLGVMHVCYWYRFCLCLYDFSAGFWNCSHSVVYFCLHFISFQATSIMNILVLTDICLLKTFITSINIQINEENDELPTLHRWHLSRFCLFCLGPLALVFLLPNILKLFGFQIFWTSVLPNILKLFGFQIFWTSVYLMKVFAETSRAHYIWYLSFHYIGTKTSQESI